MPVAAAARFGAVVWLVSAGASGAAAQAQLEPYEDSIPGTLVTFEMLPVPGGTVEVPGPNGPRTVEVDPVWIGQTEVTWDAYDVFALGLDEPGSGAAVADADAIARPSPPYGAPDYGWGHQGYPVMSVTRDAAEAFCEWLSVKTGHKYRLPTEAEWLRAVGLATPDGLASPGRLDSIAWHADNAEGTTHAVATRPADALGLYDLFGNVAEWVMTDDGARVTRGGSFRDPVSAMADSARAVQNYQWNERDPQLPKSTWWLSDAPFAGFRIVREPR